MQAQLKQADSVVYQPVESGEAQRVAMSRTELELYVRQGRPTGLLLRSVAAMKGMSANTVSAAAGIPVNLVESIFNGNGVGSIKKGAIKRVSTVLGIDLGAMKFASGQVHIFNLSRLPSWAGSKPSREILRGIGLLARGSSVAELKVGSGLQSLRWRGRMHVAQSVGFRALFIGTMSKKFGLENLPSAVWVCGDRASSTVPIENAELVKLLVASDLTEGEFDELFHGPQAMTWDDVRVASRVNGVSKAQLMEYIESRAQEQDACEDEAERLAFSEPRPALSLVHNDPRSATHA